MRLVFFILIAVSAYAQSSPCDNVQGTVTGQGQVALQCSASGIIGPPPTITITSTFCPNGIVNQVYAGCQMTATGGTPSYTWSVVSGALPSGLVMNSAGLISGTPNTAASSSALIQVKDSASPTPNTASISMAINVLASSSCGFTSTPIYACARTDWNAFPINVSSTTVNGLAPTVPPTAGSNVQGGALHACTGGGTNSGLIGCNNLYGINTIVTEPEYSNVRILRISDDTDRAECTSSGAPSQVGGGGNAGQNEFDPSSQYFRAGFCIKWIDPANFQVNTCVHRGMTSGCSPAGYVLCGYATGVSGTCQNLGQVFNLGGSGLLASYVTPGLFYYPTGGSTVTAYQITNGVVASPTVVTDYAYGVPCWVNPAGTSSNVPMCGNWVQGNYLPGSNLCPDCYTGTTSSKNLGYCFRPTSNTSTPPSCAHSFQLLNTSTCTTGTTEPNWNLAYKNTTYAINPNWLVVVQDGQCQWGDQGPPAVYFSAAGAGVAYGTAGFNTIDDNYFERGLSNWGGQDGPGVCQSTMYGVSQNTFWLMNTCTGAMYNTTCSGGTTYQCNGGTRTITYVGNHFMSPRITGTGGSQESRRFQMHSSDLGQGPNFVIPTHNNCAYKDVPYSITSISLSGNQATYTYTPIAGEPGVAVNDIVQVGGSVSGVTGYGNMFNINAPGSGSIQGGTGNPVPPTGTGVVTAVGTNSFTLTLPACGGTVGCVPSGQGNITVAQTAAYSQRWVVCQYVTGTGPSVNINPNVWFPLLGPSYSVDVFTLIGTATPGHDMRGVDAYEYMAANAYQMNKYFVMNMTNLAGNTGTLQHQPSGTVGTANACQPQRTVGGVTFIPCITGNFNVTPGLPNANYPNGANVPPPPGADCYPTACGGPYTQGAILGAPGFNSNQCSVNGVLGGNCSLSRYISFDQHMSWVTNRGGDTVRASMVPICQESYNGVWPWRSPWTGEVICWSTDGSNRIVRQAQTYNTLSSSNMAVTGTTANACSFVTCVAIGQYSQDGKYWAFNSNWFCTLGTRNGTAGPPLCGFPFQTSHAYTVGEMVGPTWAQGTTGNGNGVGAIYEVITAGTSAPALPCATSAGNSTCSPATNGYWCATTAAQAPGCQFTSGNATFKYMGPSNEGIAIFLVEMK